MASTKDEFSHESLQDQKSIVKYLNAVAEGIEKGKLTVGDDEQQFVIFPQGLLKLEFKAKRKSDKVKVEIEVSWKERQQDASTGSPLMIDAGSD